MKTIFCIDDLYHTTRAEPMLIEPLSATTNKNTYKVEVEYKMKLYRQYRQQQLNQLLWFILSFKTQRRQRFLCVCAQNNVNRVVKVIVVGDYYPLYFQQFRASYIVTTRRRGEEIPGGYIQLTM